MTPKGNIIAAAESPQGRREIVLTADKKILVEDARDVTVDCGEPQPFLRMEDNSLVVGTGSPQKLGNLSALIFEK